MDRVHSMFSNAFATPAGELVEKATASSLTTEDWGLNIQVSDTINSYSDGAKDAVKAIKKRFSSNKNFTQVTLTLSLLEACIKNCGSRFHVLVTTKEFCMDSLMKIIQPKHNPPVVLHQRVLGLIKQLAETFGSNSAMSGARHAYEELCERGFEFPKTESLEGLIGKGEPKPTNRASSRSSSNQPRSRNMDSHQSGATAFVPAGQVVNLNAEQITKLRKDLAIVEGNIKVLSEMLTELNPLQCDPSDYELLQELNRTCHAMQKRIMELLGQVSNEEITIELLQFNDDLNNVFLRYDRFERYRNNKETAKKSSEDDITLPNPAAPVGSTSHSTIDETHHEPPPSYSDTVQPTPEVNDLIDFGADTPTVKEPVSQQSSGVLSLSKELGDINLSNRSPSSTNTASHPMLSEQLASFDKPPQEVEQLGTSQEEIEQWLATEGSSIGIQPQPSTNDAAVTDEFSAFLTERATASKHLPDLPPSTN